MKHATKRKIGAGHYVYIGESGESYRVEKFGSNWFIQYGSEGGVLGEAKRLTGDDGAEGMIDDAEVIAIKEREEAIAAAARRNCDAVLEVKDDAGILFVDGEDVGFQFSNVDLDEIEATFDHERVEINQFEYNLLFDRSTAFELIANHKEKLFAERAPKETPPPETMGRQTMDEIHHENIKCAMCHEAKPEKESQFCIECNARFEKPSDVQEYARNDAAVTAAAVQTIQGCSQCKVEPAVAGGLCESCYQIDAILDDGSGPTVEDPPPFSSVAGKCPKCGERAVEMNGRCYPCQEQIDAENGDKTAVCFQIVKAVAAGLNIPTENIDEQTCFHLAKLGYDAENINVEGGILSGNVRLHITVDGWGVIWASESAVPYTGKAELSPKQIGEIMKRLNYCFLRVTPAENDSRFSFYASILHFDGNDENVLREIVSRPRKIAFLDSVKELMKKHGVGILPAYDRIEERVELYVESMTDEEITHTINQLFEKL